LKHRRETRDGLKGVCQAKMLSDEDISPALLAEAGELCALLGQSILTARNRNT
jgi:hypothetical protein